MTIHQKIAEALVIQADAKSSPLKSLLDGKTVQQVCHLIFMNYREGDGRTVKGLRLSDTGLQLMKAFFQCHDVTLTPGYRITAPHLIYMDRVNRMPYWFNSSYCAMFDSELAMMLKLADGKIQSLIDMRYRLVSSDSTLNPDQD